MTIRELWMLHVQTNGWDDIGYHWILREEDDGEWKVYAGRPIIKQGAHCIEHGRNRDSIGICVLGNYMIDKLPEKARVLLVELCVRQCVRHDIDPLRISGHRDWKDTLCPGDNLYKEINQIRIEVKDTVPLTVH